MDKPEGLSLRRSVRQEGVRRDFQVCAMNSPQVFIILLNWNGYTDTAECIRSLYRIKNPSFVMIVVDNGSLDGSVARLREEFRDVVYLENKENLGFAGGNNGGIRYALEHGADYVLLLNNDTVVEEGFLDALVQAAEKHDEEIPLSPPFSKGEERHPPFLKGGKGGFEWLSSSEKIGVVGPKIYSGLPGSSILWEAGGGIDWLHGKAYHAGFEETDVGQWDGVRDVDYVSGCAMLIKREVLEKVGLLDERFFLYYEETDFCARVREKGYRIVFVPDARIWHKESNTTGGAYGPVYTYYMTRNRLLFMKRYMDDDDWRRFLPYFYYDGLLRRSAALCFKSRNRFRSLKALLAGWRDFRQDRFYKGPEWLHL